MEVVLVAVQSLDGYITRHGEGGTGGWASPEDGEHFRREMRRFDCSVFGSATFDVDREAIAASLTPHRLRVVLTRRPQRYADVAVPGQLEFSDAAPDAVVADLAARGFSRCALLGGGRVNALFLEADLVDGLTLTLEPRVFGSGTRLVDGPCDVRFVLRSDEALNASGTRLLRYRRAPAREPGS